MADAKTNPDPDLNPLGGQEIDFGPGNSRLLIHMWRTLAGGSPVSPQEVDRIANDAGVESTQARNLLQRVSERDADENILGVMGLSLNDHPHRFGVGDVELRTWCAGDTLFLPAMLERTAKVQSASPVTGEPIRLTVSPDAIISSDPAEAAMSVPSEDPGRLASAELAAIWASFCHQIFFFASIAEGEQWAADRDNIRILSVEDAYQLVSAVWRKVRSYANPASVHQGQSQ